ncbi:hypothetical protein ABT072_42240 [Streptomyces sp. NPDC002589]|uniref:hypothetical protein n=1 Tax=Streptomyces sp. NPDC002589 TaxID=3154420 RepID=UPI00331E2D76
MRQRLLSATAATLAGVVLAVGGTGAAHAATAAPAHSAAPADDPTPDEQGQLRVVAAAIWNQQLADGWNMNSDVADVLSQATGAILKCSEAFALVPKPPGFIPGASYLVKYTLQLRNYFQAVRGDRTYRTCVVAASADYRSAIELASMGA